MRPTSISADDGELEFVPGGQESCFRNRLESEKILPFVPSVFQAPPWQSETVVIDLETRIRSVEGDERSQGRNAEQPYEPGNG